MPNVIEIPITSDFSSFKIRTELEGFKLVLKFDWNGRDERWQISISDGDEVLLIGGIPLNINTEFLERWEIDGLPPGKMILYDTSDSLVEASLEDLGSRCRLFYEESE